MKKAIVSLLCVLLCFQIGMPCFASASGLEGLKGGLPDIGAFGDGSDSGDPGVLPDPAELLGDGAEGTLYAEDYDFDTDFICNVYTYDVADDDFLDDYVARAEANGFTASETTVEGYDAYRLEYGDLAALLLPDYEGVMMLLVQNGIEFGESLPEYYVRMVYNGRKVLTDEVDFMKSYDAYQYKFEYFDAEQEPSYFVMRFPKSMRAGDDCTWTPDSVPDYLYVYDGDKILMNYQDFTRSGEWGGSDDFFQLKIVTKEETPQGLLIEGRFSAMLDYASITIENGSFRILVK